MVAPAIPAEASRFARTAAAPKTTARRLSSDVPLGRRDATLGATRRTARGASAADSLN
jgi:hypothetical protein